MRSNLEIPLILRPAANVTTATLLGEKGPGYGEKISNEPIGLSTCRVNPG